MIYIGIDPGINGAVGVLTDSGEYLDVQDIPTCVIENKSHVDSYMLFRFLEKCMDYGRCSLAIEKVHSMPNQSAQSGFTFGQTVGRICACFELLNLESVLYVSPQKWKKHFNLSKDKKESVELAHDLFPDAALYGPKGGAKHDRAEALLIARWLKDEGRL